MQHTTEWYTDWFSSPYYHILYQQRGEDEARLFLDHLLEQLDPASGATILDMGCGRGRHSRYLHQKGYRVHGVDISPSNIRFLAEFAREDLTFAVHDFREPYLPAAFDLIFNIFTSFGYFEEEEENFRTLQAARQGLRPEGRFVIDYLNAPKITAALPHREVKTVNGIDFHIDKRLHENMIRKRISFTDQGKDYAFEERVSALPPDTLKRMIREAGMAVCHTFGSYQLDPYTPDSERVILVAKIA